MTTPATTRRPLRTRLLGATAATALALGGVALTASPAYAATFTVTTLSDVVDPFDGVTSLREAVESANVTPGADTILFQAGLTGTIYLESTLALNEAVTIDGTGATITVSIDDGLGAGFALFRTNSLDDVKLSDFRITDDGGSLQVGARALYIFFGGTITLEDMVIVNFDAGPGPGGCIIGSAFTAFVMNRSSVSSCEVDAGFEGGGAYLVGGTFSATDSNFNSNTADLGGGLSLLNSVGVTLLRTTFANNQATVTDGGGLRAALTLGAVQITDSRFEENSAFDEGGGAYITTPGAITVTGSTFDDNDAARGAGIYFAGSPFNVTGSIFTSNTATGSGGAIGNGNGFFTGQIADTTFESNQANEGAALAAPIDANFTILRSSFIDNRFDVSGAIRVGGSGIDNGTLTIDSSTFSGQRQYAGAVALATGASLRAANITPDGALVIVNTTIDETENVGSAIYLSSVDGVLDVRNSTLRGPSFVLDDIDGTATISNSILQALNPVNDPILGAVDAGTLTLRYSIVSAPIHAGAIDGGGNLFSTDPDLGALALNGGTTMTRLPAAGSAAINAGDPAFVAPPTVDQRGAGFARVATGRLDIGAVEVQAAALPPTGGTVSWWLLYVAGGVLIVGGGALLFARRRRGPGAHRS